MRIIPPEIFKYTPDNSLTALRKEFGMYDYCLNVNPNNKAMQLYLDLGRNYFNYSLFEWIKEMMNRNHYVNTFHYFYAKNNKFNVVDTDTFLIIECIIQWDLKEFEPYNTDKSWYDLANVYLYNSKYKIDLSLDIYNFLCEYYKDNYMNLNDKGKLKTKQLDIIKVIEYFKQVVLNK
ncbi:hypothetical protein SCORR_v1c04250 [Spiroplasma corruscae]|uniref:Uncharacterized protein n=1 Tax=Spiroplasma corruscae TaxID=216934 RepID=A0A222ENW5_9MOLU|nr:hypothetical protein [Spiroplasma corruscae]ASP28199.1 hypothetical protein SCORR_v1c04250 [Spiroplasma corruscae]